jgi:hypothetical protein
VMIGGIKQAITIRGDDLSNPILLVIHGGPGYVETPLRKAMLAVCRRTIAMRKLRTSLMATRFPKRPSCRSP